MKQGVAAVVLVTGLIASIGTVMAHPRTTKASTVAASSAGATGQLADVVCVGLPIAYGAVLAGGRDPDPFIRNSLLREYAVANVYSGKARPGGRCESSR